MNGAIHPIIVTILPVKILLCSQQSIVHSKERNQSQLVNMDHHVVLRVSLRVSL